MRVFTASPLQLLTRFNHFGSYSLDILQVDGDAAHLAQLIVMTRSKSDTSTAQLGKECSESYRRLGPDPDVSQLKAVKVPRHRKKIDSDLDEPDRKESKTEKATLKFQASSIPSQRPSDQKPESASATTRQGDMEIEIREGTEKLSRSYQE